MTACDPQVDPADRLFELAVGPMTTLEHDLARAEAVEGERFIAMVSVISAGMANLFEARPAQHRELISLVMEVFEDDLRMLDEAEADGAAMLRRAFE